MNTPATYPIPKGLSPTAIEKYENCPLSYFFAQIEKLPDPKGEPALVGTFVHKVLEDLFARDPQARLLDEARLIAKAEFPAFAASSDFAELGLDAPGVAAFKKRCWSMIEGYFALEDPRTVQPEGMERWVRSPIAGAPVRGIIDRLDRVADKLIIADYKTGKAPDKRWVADKFKAMKVYAACLHAETGELASELRLLFLAKPIEHTLEVSADTLTEVHERVDRVWTKINTDCARGEFQATPNNLCNWCAAKAYCPAQGGSISDGIAVAQATRVARSSQTPSVSAVSVSRGITV